MLHHRSFELARMSHSAQARKPEPRNVVARKLEIGEACNPGTAVEFMSKLGGEHIDEPHVPAMPIDQHEPPETMRHDAPRNIFDERNHRLGPQRDGAWKSHVMLGKAI